MTRLAILAALAAPAFAAPAQYQRSTQVMPQVKLTRYIANVTDPSLSRDSCGSARIGDRAFWTCRDTTIFDAATDSCYMPLVTNSAGWTDQTMMGPLILGSGEAGAGSTGSNPILQMYGMGWLNMGEYFPVLFDNCPGNGICNDADDTRWAIWPDSPPVITESGDDGSAVGYTWISQSHLQDLTSLIAEPAYTLYKTSYTPPLDGDRNVFPQVSIVEANFWKQGEIGFGQYGNVVKDGTLYMYGQTGDKKGTVLAKVSTSEVEDRSKYSYYHNSDNSWSSTPPTIDDDSSVIPNAGGGGQGTFYWSGYFNSFMWIGQMGISGSADFYLTTAPTPEGPWIEPYKIFEGTNGDSGIAGGYSLQAHPALLPSGMEAKENGIYITWTEDWALETYAATYVTPLVWVEFK